MTLKSDKCNDVITIPQKKGTCWFNAILMTILYSQHSRNLLLTDNNLDKKKDKISKILNQLLKHNYIKYEMHEDYFKYMRPEIILKYLDFFPTKEEYKEVLEKGYLEDIIISKFIKKLGKTCLYIDVYKDKLYPYMNLLRELFFKCKNTIKFLKASIKLFEDIYSMKEKNLKINPDYIIVDPYEYRDNDGTQIVNGSKGLFDIFFNFGSEDILNKLELDFNDIKTKGIHTYENEIIYNGDKYVLDSCLLANYNARKEGAHAIAGVTCNNNRYVYNGWIRQSIYDGWLKDIFNKNITDIFKYKHLPCELMKFDWDINRPNPFCLSLKGCKLDPVNINTKNRMCFSFDRGPRSLIYVKVNKLDEKRDMFQNFSSSNSLTLPSTSKLSNIDEIIQKRKIKKILKEKIIKKKLKIKSEQKRKSEKEAEKEEKEPKKKEKEPKKKEKEPKKKDKETKKKQMEAKKKEKEAKKKQMEARKKQMEARKKEMEAKQKRKI
jgi:hypothetical protein